MLGAVSVEVGSVSTLSLESDLYFCVDLIQANVKIICSTKKFTATILKGFEFLKGLAALCVYSPGMCRARKVIDVEQQNCL